MKKFLFWLGVLAAVAGLVVALGGADVDRPAFNPTAGVALAFCGFVFLKGSERL